MRNMTFEDALAEHELDVAGLEIWDKRKQLDNLKLWLSRVKPLEQAKVDDMLMRLEKLWGANKGRARK